MYDNNGYNNSPILAVKGAKGGKLTFILAFLVLIAAVVFLLHSTGTIDVVKFVNEKILHKEELKESDKEKDNDKDSENVVDVDMQTELLEMCMLVDENGDYNYDEYLQYVSDEAAKLTEKPSESETFEIMSGMGYCASDMCMHLEKDGTVNALTCSNGEYLRMSYYDFQDYLWEQISINLILNTACANVDNNGFYVIDGEDGEASVKCDNFICVTDYNGSEHTKDCRINE